VSDLVGNRAAPDEQLGQSYEPCATPGSGFDELLGFREIAATVGARGCLNRGGGEVPHVRRPTLTSRSHGVKPERRTQKVVCLFA
jgi:hypothetical protein